MQSFCESMQLSGTKRPKRLDEIEAREFRVFYAALTMMQYVCENIW